MVSLVNVKLGQVGNDIHEALAKWCDDEMCCYFEGDGGVLIILDNGVNQLPRLVI
jgi:hypothetical protein